MADKNFKKDPDVIAHVEQQVAKATIGAIKAEQNRITALVKSFAATNKEQDHDKVTAKVVATNFKDLLVAIKNPAPAGE